MTNRSICITISFLFGIILCNMHFDWFTQEEEWSKDVILPESQELLGGRTPLQIACARDDSYKVPNTWRLYLLNVYHWDTASLYL